MMSAAMRSTESPEPRRSGGSFGQTAIISVGSSRSPSYRDTTHATTLLDASEGGTWPLASDPTRFSAGKAGALLLPYPRDNLARSRAIALSQARVGVPDDEAQ
jgi:hypothetical protein